MSCIAESKLSEKSLELSCCPSTLTVKASLTSGEYQSREGVEPEASVLPEASKDPEASVLPEASRPNPMNSETLMLMLLPLASTFPEVSSGSVKSCVE